MRVLVQYLDGHPASLSTIMVVSRPRVGADYPVFEYNASDSPPARWNPPPRHACWVPTKTIRIALNIKRLLYMEDFWPASPMMTAYFSSICRFFSGACAFFHALSETLMDCNKHGLSQNTWKVQYRFPCQVFFAHLTRISCHFYTGC